MTRYIGTCRDGHSFAGTAETFPEHRPYEAGTLLGLCRFETDHKYGCGQTLRVWPVKAVRGKRECGAWCADGSGRKCTCVCEGKNHGSTYSHTGALWYAR